MKQIDIRGELQEIERQTEQNQERLYAQISDYSEVQRAIITKIKQALQHLDKVLQVESKHRVAQTQKIQVDVACTQKRLLADFEALQQRKSDELHAGLAELHEISDRNARSAVEQKNGLDSTLAHWKSSSSKSTAAIKARLDEIRAERIGMVSTIRIESERGLREIKHQLLNAQMQIDEQLVNLRTRAEQAEKRFEGTNKEDLAEFEQVARTLQEQLRKERQSMQQMHDDTSKALSVAVETLENSMALYERFGAQ